MGDTNLVLISEAAEQSNYTEAHIRYLLRENLVNGQKKGGIWLVDLDSLQEYENRMDQLGTQKHTAKKYKRDN